MVTAPSCLIVSFDYLDFDVYLNIRIFYCLAGFRLLPLSSPIDSDLLVILRGQPPRTYPNFTGIIHVYDYVRELTINYRLYFPNAAFIYYVSIKPSPASIHADKYISAYLPVFPDLWCMSTGPKNRSSRPVHIANYKPMSNDPYQQQLLALIVAKKICVFGAKWDRLNISTNPLSYRSANRVLSKSLLCYGLMYPYQRGTSLSGRMWQAPLHGCTVISEPGTNIFDCPGIHEMDDFRSQLNFPHFDPHSLSLSARLFWTRKTYQLARELSLSLDHAFLNSSLFHCRLLLLKQHIVFMLHRSIISRYDQIRFALRRRLSILLKPFRSPRY